MKDLVKLAYKAQQNAYVPYSNFAVGAALLCKNKKVYLGCNIESGTYTPTSCAERTAFFKAVSEGEREFEAIAIVGNMVGQEGDFCAPCGVCRQVMTEFCQPEFKVILGKGEEYKVYTLEEIMPFGVNPLKK